MKSYKETLRITASLAMLAAISIIAGKFLAIRGGDILRFSFENLPIIFAGFSFGPVAGVLVGVCADIIGCIMVSYAINPMVTLGAAAIGLVSGLVPYMTKRIKVKTELTLALSVGAAHILGSVIIKTFGLAIYYDMPITILFLWRLLNYLIVGGAEYALLLILLKNKGIALQLARLKGELK